MGKLIWYSTGVVLVGLLVWTAYVSVRGDFDGPTQRKTRFIRSF